MKLSQNLENLLNVIRMNFSAILKYDDDNKCKIVVVAVLHYDNYKSISSLPLHLQWLNLPFLIVKLFYNFSYFFLYFCKMQRRKIVMHKNLQRDRSNFLMSLFYNMLDVIAFFFSLSLFLLLDVKLVLFIYTQFFFSSYFV